MNAILKECYASRGGNYCHAIEVSEVCEIENTIVAIINEHREKGIKVIKEFINTLEVYFIGCDDSPNSNFNEDEVYNFDFDKFIDENY